jgi:L-glutamine:scyllo-inosose aminotransferase/L-glutamine:2-deoxy-scyllo-inosose/3-amino-2,3-dideoxy-scyllo-inosose aminotransferase
MLDLPVALLVGEFRVAPDATASRQSQALAVQGGEPVRSASWPRWPQADDQTVARMLDVLRSGHWAISSPPGAGRVPYERRFAEAFAEFCGVDHCVPTVNGSAALVIALQALGCGDGDEVLVPGISWVAVAAAVLAVGARPILVDVDPRTLCISLEQARAHIGGRTKAIVLVHQNCSLCDLPGFLALQQETGIRLVEDCSQCHGARYQDRGVGSLGDVATFSLQQSKLMTSGEGGVVITSDAALYDRLQQLRANGRRYGSTWELEEIGDFLGQNFLMSEFHAALALDGLGRLGEQHRTRERNARVLTGLLAEIEGVSPLCWGPEPCSLAYHKYTVRVDRQQFAGVDVTWLARAIGAELGLSIGVLDPPLNRNPLLVGAGGAPAGSDASVRFPRFKDHAYDPTGFELPEATRASRECLTIRHHNLLGEERSMHDIAAAFSKVKRFAAALAAAASSG